MFFDLCKIPYQLPLHDCPKQLYICSLCFVSRSTCMHCGTHLSVCIAGAGGGCICIWSDAVRAVQWAASLGRPLHWRYYLCQAAHPRQPSPAHVCRLPPGPPGTAAAPHAVSLVLSRQCVHHSAVDFAMVSYKSVLTACCCLQPCQ